MGSSPPPSRVLIVGAGPVGLLTALRLATATPPVPITILEALPEIESSPRAMAYQPIAVKELDRAGILADVRKIGSKGQRICWRRPRKDGDEAVIADMERKVTSENPYENLIVGQHELAGVILEKLEKCEGVKVEFGTKVVGIEDKEGDNTGRAKVLAETSSGDKKTYEADWVVGADGGKSSVRRICGINYEGFTWPQQLVSTNVYYPFDKYGWYDGNFIVDNKNWALIAKINERGLWRVSYGELEGLKDPELLDRLPMKFDAMFPGPGPLDYKLDQRSPYRIHQRCASRFRDGHILLAGDAAHLCNPFGGLGLTGGLLDAAALADALIAHINDEVPEDILDTYATSRRDVFQRLVNPASRANKRRLDESDPETVGETDPFLKMLRELDADGKQKIRGMEGLWVDVREVWEKEQQEKRAVDAAI